jgi:acyl-CoA synthetase (AMP-forming)/AMP-acid ligase II
MRSASIFFGVPTMYHELTETPGAADAVRHLRLCICGSAPLNDSLSAKILSILGKQVIARYGTTESGLNLSNPTTAPRIGTVGFPLPGVLCRLVDGEIQLRGPQVFSGYWNNPTATSNSFTTDGWFRTGDLGSLSDGHVKIIGRTSELIISGGMNVYPREIESVLEEHPSVAEVAVGGIPSARWGEEVVAWVVTRPEHAFDELGLIAHVKNTLSSYKCPKKVFQLSSLPRNHMGKIVRSDLNRHL